MTSFGKKTTGAPTSFGKKTSSAPAGQGRFTAASSARAAPAAPMELSTKAMAFIEAERAQKGSAAPSYATAPLTPAYASASDGGLTAGKPVFGRRIIALFIDGIVIGLPIGFVIGALGPQPNMTDAQFGAGFLGMLLFIVVGSLVYHIGMEASKAQATLGKMAVGIIVVDKMGGKPSFGAVILRNTVGKLVSNILPFYIGYFIGLARPDRRCLHDLIAGTMVCTKGAQTTSYQQTFA
jgi:uncharacterized RDD family membrane protein YckC